MSAITLASCSKQVLRMQPVTPLGPNTFQRFTLLKELLTSTSEIGAAIRSGAMRAIDDTSVFTLMKCA